MLLRISGVKIIDFTHINIKLNILLEIVEKKQIYLKLQKPNKLSVIFMALVII